MRIFLAGATGAVGRPLVRALLEQGHEVAALTRSSESAQRLWGQGVDARVGDALDPAAVREAVVGARPEAVIHQLTSLARMDMSRYRESFGPTDRLRRETVPTFVAAAREAGARRVIVQSVAFFARPGGAPVVDESAPLYLDAPEVMRPSIEAVAILERAATRAEALEGVVLRYGLLYGPGTGIAPDGDAVAAVRAGLYPVVGEGRGRMSLVHVDDAVAATLLALEGAPGTYHVTDDHPAPTSEWLPGLARLLGAPEPPRLPAPAGDLAAGDPATHYSDLVPGASNAKAREELGFVPRYPSWREGFPAALGLVANSA